MYSSSVECMFSMTPLPRCEPARARPAARRLRLRLRPQRRALPPAPRGRWRAHRRCIRRQSAPPIRRHVVLVHLCRGDALKQCQVHRVQM